MECVYFLRQIRERADIGFQQFPAAMTSSRTWDTKPANFPCIEQVVTEIKSYDHGVDGMPGV